MAITISTFKSGKAQGRVHGQFSYGGKDFINICLANVNSASGKSFSDDEGRHASISWSLGQVKRVLRQAFNWYAVFERNAAGLISIKVCDMDQTVAEGLKRKAKEGTEFTDLTSLNAQTIQELDIIEGKGSLVPQMRLIRRDSDYFAGFSDEDFNKYIEEHAAREVNTKTGEVVGFRKVNLMTGEIGTGALEENECRYSYDTVYVAEGEEQPNLWVGLGDKEQNAKFGEMVRSANTRRIVKEKTEELVPEEEFENE